MFFLLLLFIKSERLCASSSPDSVSLYKTGNHMVSLLFKNSRAHVHSSARRGPRLMLGGVSADIRTRSHRCLVSPTEVSSLTFRQGSSLHLLITISSWRVKWRSVLCLTFDPVLFMWRTSNPVWGWLGRALMRPRVCPLGAERLDAPLSSPTIFPWCKLKRSQLWGEDLYWKGLSA